MTTYADLPPVLDVPGVAKILGCSPDTIRAEIRAGRLPHVRVGRLIRIPRHQLVAYLEGGHR